MSKIVFRKVISECLLVTIFLNACGTSEHPVHDTRKKTYCIDKNFKSKIEFVLPKSERVTEKIPLTGTVEPNPDKVLHFVSLVGGIISKTYFSLGDKVYKGQVLAELKSSHLLELQSQARTIEAQIKVAEKNLKSVKSMFDDGVASQKDLIEAESQLAILQAERDKIQSILTLFSASTEKGVFQIISPATGIITEKFIVAGQQISAEGEPLFTISDLNEVWVMLNIYASNIQNIEPGLEVNIQTLSYPNEIFKGKISTISQVLDTENRVLKAKVVLPNTDLKLKPGMLVDVMVIKGHATEALKIPRSAIIFDDNQDFVVIYKGECDLQIRKVSIVGKVENEVYVIDGIAENEKIIAKNHLLIYEQIKNFNY